jgi:hypothetical protein
MADNEIDIRRSQAVRDFGVGAIVDVPGTSVMTLAIDVDPWAWGGKNMQTVNDLRLQEMFGVDLFGLPPEKEDEENKKYRTGIRTEHFPNAHICPNCDKIQFIHDLEKNNPAYKELVHKEPRNGAWFCVTCKQKTNGSKEYTLVPSRFIIATEYGLIDDFPYDWFCHSDPKYIHNRTVCHKEGAGNNNLKLISEGSSLGDMYVKCKCGAKKSLGTIFNTDESNVLRSSGNYLKWRKGRLSAPWTGRYYDSSKGVLGDFKQEAVYCPPDTTLKVKILESTEPLEQNEKKYFPRVLQRGAGNAYFPVTYTGVCLPESSYSVEPKNELDIASISEVLDKCYDDLDYLKKLKVIAQEEILCSEFESLNSDDPKDVIKFLLKWNELKPTIFNDLLKKNKIEKSTLTISLEKLESNFSVQKDQRKVEYECFKNRNIKVESGEWYKTEFIDKGDLDELSDFIEEIVLIHKIKFLQIQRGFTRVRPLAFEDLALAKADTDVDKGFKDEYNRIVDVRIHPEDWVDRNGITKERTNWLPAAEIKGEGIFLRFKREVIDAWVKKHAEFVNVRSSTISENNWNGMKSFNPSLTELERDKMEKSPTFILIHTLSHLLINEISKESGYNAASISEIIYEGDGMEGLLIYTTTSDTEGSLGGLVSMGYPDRLQIVFREALEKARWCSSDPICIESKGQGFLGTNLASCYSCSMLPETSCQYINRFLDRGLLIGTIESPDSGFFNHIGFFK